MCSPRRSFNTTFLLCVCAVSTAGICLRGVFSLRKSFPSLLPNRIQLWLFKNLANEQWPENKFSQPSRSVQIRCALSVIFPGFCISVPFEEVFVCAVFSIHFRASWYRALFCLCRVGPKTPIHGHVCESSSIRRFVMPGRWQKVKEYSTLLLRRRKSLASKQESYLRSN